MAKTSTAVSDAIVSAAVDEAKGSATAIGATTGDTVHQRRDVGAASRGDLQQSSVIGAAAATVGSAVQPRSAHAPAMGATAHAPAVSAPGFQAAAHAHLSTFVAYDCHDVAHARAQGARARGTSPAAHSTVQILANPSPMKAWRTEAQAGVTHQKASQQHVPARYNIDGELPSLRYSLLGELAPRRWNNCALPTDGMSAHKQSSPHRIGLLTDGLNAASAYVAATGSTANKQQAQLERNVSMAANTGLRASGSVVEQPAVYQRRSIPQQNNPAGAAASGGNFAQLQPLLPLANFAGNAGTAHSDTVRTHSSMSGKPAAGATNPGTEAATSDRRGQRMHPARTVHDAREAASAHAAGVPSQEAVSAKRRITPVRITEAAIKRISPALVRCTDSISAFSIKACALLPASTATGASIKGVVPHAARGQAAQRTAVLAQVLKAHNTAKQLLTQLRHCSSAHASMNGMLDGERDRMLQAAEHCKSSAACAVSMQWEQYNRNLACYKAQGVISPDDGAAAGPASSGASEYGGMTSSGDYCVFSDATVAQAAHPDDEAQSGLVEAAPVDTAPGEQRTVQHALTFDTSKLGRIQQTIDHDSRADSGSGNVAEAANTVSSVVAAGELSYAAHTLVEALYNALVPAQQPDVLHSEEEQLAAELLGLAAELQAALLTPQQLGL